MLPGVRGLQAFFPAADPHGSTVLERARAVHHFLFDPALFTPAG